jgi:hypothetical protein
MKAGEIVLLRLPQANLLSGKLRPVLVLSDLPGPWGLLGVWNFIPTSPGDARLG